MAGFNSPLFLLGLGSGTERAGFRGPLPLPSLGAGGQEQAGFRSPLPIPPFGAGEDTQQAGFPSALPVFWGYAGEAIVLPPVGGGRGYDDEEDEILSLVIAIHGSIRWTRH